ncbi:MAG TPA: 4Fe-4S dicluster domain-containing protein, partial [Asanoa sp.]|nr:4Fe-4S dicluster domain-containing protein [Asanoa sp.]
MVGPNSFYGPIDPAPDAGYVDAPPRMGFFTDTSVCIGCKACEVACKEWNGVPDDGFNLLGMSYDNTGALTANSWRHVAFIEQPRPVGWQSPPMAGTPTGPPVSPATAEVGAGTAVDTGTRPGVPAAPDPAPAGRMADGTQFLGMPGTDLPGRGDREERTDLRWLMMSDVCKHCTHAACLDVCPTGSLFRAEFGTVVVQEDICNGCGYCIPA